jgi:hypothetical protein
MRLLLALIALLALAPAARAQDPVAPAVTTDPAAAITRTGATLNASVDPNGSETTYHFEYGTTTAYGLQTPDASAGAGADPAARSAAVTGLTPDTTYHFRVVAANAAGTVNGRDRTLKTLRDPTPPVLSLSSAIQIGPQGATLRGSVDPNRGAASYRFQYGTTTGYGRLTPRLSAGGGDAKVNVSAAVAGLRPYTRYHFRLTATNSAGTTYSGDRSFVTQRLPTSITLALPRPRIAWGAGLEITGDVDGAGVNGIPVVLQRQDFPFLGDFSTVGTPAPVRGDHSGRFSFYIPAVFTTTRLRAFTQTPVGVTSNVVQPLVAVHVGAAVARIAKKRSRIRGTISPAVPDARVVLQRRTKGRRWVFSRGRGVTPLGGDRSRYTFKVKRTRKARVYRVKVFPRDDGAHVSGTSRQVRVRGLPRKKRP